MLDTHAHAWGPPSRDHPWVNGKLVADVDEYRVDTIYDAPKLLAEMDAVGVDRAVVVAFPLPEWTDNWYTVEAATEYDRLLGVGLVDPFADDAADRLRALMDNEGVLGVRLGGAWPADGMWRTHDYDATWLRESVAESEFWTAATETDALVQITVHYSQYDQALALVEAYPDLTYVIDHFGFARPPVSLVEAGFDEFAEHSNVALKVSGAPNWSNEAFPYTDLHDHVRWALSTLGRERVVWGSDYPNVSGKATYEESVAWLDHVDGLSNGDREWLTRRSFERHVGL
jgi:predicted TIM-barrel fold metal-dependent hydrolase